MKILSHLSGGFDSVATCIKLLNEGNEVTGLFFDLGQVYLDQEAKAAKYVDEFLQENYSNWNGLLTKTASMELQSADDGSPTEYIPVRNLVLSAHSANIAIALGLDAVAVGNKTTTVREDDPYSFSDCSIEFYDKLTDIVSFASENNIEVEFLMPLVTWVDEHNKPTKKSAGCHPIPLTKGDVLRIIIDAGLDLTKIWSCYHNTVKPCGECYHCVELKHAMDEIDYNYVNFFSSEVAGNVD